MRSGTHRNGDKSKIGKPQRERHARAFYSSMEEDFTDRIHVFLICTTHENG